MCGGRVGGIIHLRLCIGRWVWRPLSCIQIGGTVLAHVFPDLPYLFLHASRSIHASQTCVGHCLQTDAGHGCSRRFGGVCYTCYIRQGTDIRFKDCRTKVVVFAAEAPRCVDGTLLIFLPNVVVIRLAVHVITNAAKQRRPTAGSRQLYSATDAFPCRDGEGFVDGCGGNNWNGAGRPSRSMRDEYQPIRGGNMHRARKLYGGRGAFAEGRWHVFGDTYGWHMCGGRLDLLSFTGALLGGLRQTKSWYQQPAT